MASSRKQPIHTTAEIFAYSEAVKDARLIQFRLSELGVNLTLPLMIQVDNRGVQSFATGSCVDTKLRGIWDLRSAWVKELRNLEQVKPVKIATSFNCADGLTKCLPERKFISYLDNCVRG